MSLTISTATEPDRVVVAVSGEVDVSNAPELREAVDAALATGVLAVTVDASDMSYIDSTGIGVLVGAAHRAADEGKALSVANPQRNVSRVLALLGLTDELGVG